MALSRKTTKAQQRRIPARPTPGRAVPRRPMARTPQAAPPGARAPAPAASNEPILEESAPPNEIVSEEVDLGLEADEPVAKSPSGQHAVRGSGGNARPGSGVRKSTGKAAPAEMAAKDISQRRSRATGAEIGPLQRRGWSLALKYSVFTLLVVVLITALFGYVSIRGLKTSLLDEIKRSGYDNILTLHAFGQKAAQPFKGVRQENAFRKILHEYAESEEYKKRDLPYLQRIVEGDKRIKDVAIFGSYDASTMPSTPIIRVDPAGSLTDGPNEPLNIDSRDSAVKIHWGQYGEQSCLFFRMPLEPGPQPGTMYSSVNLIMSASEIDNQVQDFVRKLLLFGLLFTAMGVGMSLFFASLMSKPINTLVNDVNTVARGDLEHESAVPSQTNDEIGLLAMAFNRMTHNLREAQEKERDAQRIAGEINTAKAIHAKLIPEKLPNLPNIDIGVQYQCAKEVGGDYYDFIPVGDDKHLAFCVADVSGKGIPGSMVMGTTRTILRMMAVNNMSAADVLSKTNYHVARDIKRGMFVTCVYAILNVLSREMTVASAGHNPMLIWRAASKTIEKVRPNGIALGFDKGPIFNRTVREEKLKLCAGDRVVMYTDGVVESMNEKHDEWTDEALDQFTLKHATVSSKEFVRLLLKALAEHQGKAEQHDDITIVTFRIS